MKSHFFILLIGLGVSCKQSEIQDNLVILNPNAEITTNEDSILIEGEIVRGTNTTEDKVFLAYTLFKGQYGDEVVTDENYFRQKVYLKDTVNHFVIRLVGDYGHVKSEKHIIVHRTASAELLTEIQNRLDTEQNEQKRLDEIFGKQNELEEKYKIAWENSKAGKIQKKYPLWSKQDCERVANKEIWIGMHYLMLIEERGYPDSKNVSNYGNGDEYQWCWLDYVTSCFYDKNGDMIIDGYN